MVDPFAAVANVSPAVYEDSLDSAAHVSICISHEYCNESAVCHL